MLRIRVFYPNPREKNYSLDMVMKMQFMMNDDLIETLNMKMMNDFNAQR